jgi:hypothetical protein
MWWATTFPRRRPSHRRTPPTQVACGTPACAAASVKQHRLQTRVHRVLLARGHDLVLHHASSARSKRPSATWCRRCGLKFEQDVGLPALLRLPDCLGTLSVDPIHLARGAAATATAASGSGVHADAAAAAGAANEPSDAQDELPGHLQIATRLVAPPGLEALPHQKKSGRTADRRARCPAWVAQLLGLSGGGIAFDLLVLLQAGRHQ